MAVTPQRFTNTLTGARAKFYISTLTSGSDVVALATGVSITININYEPVHILDLLEVEEFCESSYECSMSCETMRVIGSSPIQQGYSQPIGVSRTADLQSILNQPELTATLIDEMTGKQLAIVQGIKPQGNSFDVRAGQVVANNLTFVCKRVLQEGDTGVV